jgi:beta-fructofuranosidase
MQSMQQAIDNASSYIAEYSPMVCRGDMRQSYHFMGPCGWINDPNGLIYYKNQYHFFYQFNPYSGFWGQMNWGHAVSEDLLHWRHLPIALAPSERYDDHPQGGCFSGSAIEKDGKLYLIYTGTANHGKGFVQTQNVAVSEDGIHFVKYEGNPVVEAPDAVPTDYFRDPKVWEHEDRYYMVVGAQKAKRAEALLYQSEDLLHWRFRNVLFESRGEWGYMWECSDFFPLGDKWVYLCSPMGAGDRTTVYFVGDFDYDTGRFVYTVTGEMDWGFDFYAPQTFLDGEGRRLAVGWANEWDWMPFWKDWGPTYREGWCGAFSVPREVILNADFSLSFRPIAELASLRTDAYVVPSMQIGNEREYPATAGDGVHFELKFGIQLKSTDAKCMDLLLRCDGDHRTICTFDFMHDEIRVDRNAADGWSMGVAHGPFAFGSMSEVEIDIFGDTSSLEIFIDGGRSVYSMNVFAETAQSGITFRSHGGVTLLANVEGFGIRL